MIGSIRHERTRGVVVTHPGGGQMRSFEIAAGLERAGLLQRYIAGFYFKADRPWSRAMGRLAGSVHPRIAPLLLGRRHPELSPDKVKTHSAADLACLGLGHMLHLRRAASGLIPWRNRWFDARVAREIERERPAAVFCYESCALRAFRRARELGIVSVLDQCTAHIRTGQRLMREEAKRHPDWADTLPREFSATWVDNCCEEQALAGAILISSDYAKQTLIENGVDAQKIYVNPIAADIFRFEPRPPQKKGEPFRVLFVGQVTQRKGVAYLLEAFRQLNLPNSELILVGGLPGSGRGLRRYLGKNVRHVPSVPFLELHRYYQTGSIFVMPSLHESGVLSIHEALASGLPVIATPNCGSVVRDGIEGFIVPIRDVEALKKKILLLFEIFSLREEMSCRARKRAEEFTWAAYQRSVVHLFRALLGTSEEQAAGAAV